MGKLKVALIYRGQTRMSNVGAAWLERIRSQLSDVDLQTFGHTSAMETIAYVDEDSDISKVNFRSCRKLTEKTVQQRLKKFGHRSFRIFGYGHVYHQAKPILDYWLQHREFREFVERVGDDNHFLRKFFVSNFPRNLFIIGQLYAQRDLYYNGHLEVGDFMSQYISAGHSFQMLNDYCGATGWKPDIVISLRYDTALKIHDIYQIYADVNNSNVILANGVILEKQGGKANDLAFIMDFNTAEDFLGDIDSRMQALLTDWKVLASLSSFDPIGIPHTFWNFLIRNNTVMRNSGAFDAAVFRPGLDKKFDMETVDIANIHSYFKEWNTNLSNRLELLPGNMRHGEFDLDYALDMLGIDKDDIFK